MEKVKRCPKCNESVPSLDLLQARLEQGCYFSKDSDGWWLFDKNGEGIVGGKTIRDVLISLMFLKC